jgi:hypothetical protein
MLVLAHSRSLFDKFSGDGKPLAPVDLAVTQTRRLRRPRPPPQLTRCSVSESQSKTRRPEWGVLVFSKTAAPILQPPETLVGGRKFCRPERPYLDKKILPSYGIVLSPPAV